MVIADSVVVTRVVALEVTTSAVLMVISVDAHESLDANTVAVVSVNLVVDSDVAFEEGW